MTPTTLMPSIDAACARWGDRPAMTHAGRTLTYAELGDRIRALTAAWRALGIRPGDRVICQLPVCPEHFVVLGATWAAAAVHVGAHRDLTGAELVDLARQTGARALVHQAPPGATDPLAAVRAVSADCPSATLVVHGGEPPAGCHRLSDLLEASPPTAGAPAVAAASDGPDLLLLTSGTTGRPKAVMETRAALWAKMQAFAELFSPGEDDVHLVYLPVCHAFGLKLSLTTLASGGRLVLLDRFSPEHALRLVAEEGVTQLSGAPAHLTLLLHALDPVRDRVDTLRWAVCAASSLDPVLFDAVRRRLVPRMLYVYGCSEGFMTLTTDPDEIRRGSVGRRVFRGPEGTPPDGTVAVIDPDTGERVPVGEVGEIVYGAARPVRYWGAPDVAADGWYRTGDLGRLDEDGRLYVCGRLKELINRGGLKVASGEVERVLAGHPGVADCAVVPAPDPVLGEAICACVVPAAEPPPDLAELRRHLGQTLARHKLPDELCILGGIPRSVVGKIDRAALSARVAAGDLPRSRFRPAPASTAASVS